MVNVPLVDVELLTTQVATATGLSPDAPFLLLSSILRLRFCMTPSPGLPAGRSLVMGKHDRTRRGLLQQDYPQPDPDRPVHPQGDEMIAARPRPLPVAHLSHVRIEALAAAHMAAALPAVRRGPDLPCPLQPFQLLVPHTNVCTIQPKQVGRAVGRGCGCARRQPVSPQGTEALALTGRRTMKPVERGLYFRRGSTAGPNPR